MTEPNVEFENDRVRVSRVRQESAGTRPAASRHDRLIVYLEDSEIVRESDGEREQIRRKAGDVVWRDASEHTIEVADDSGHEVLVIELKP